MPVQRDPVPAGGQSRVQPSATWVRVDASLASISNKLTMLALAAPSATRSRWRAELRTERDRLGLPGTVPDKELGVIELSVGLLEGNIRADAERARGAWQDLQGPYFAEVARLANDVNIGPKATQLLNEQYRDADRRVTTAGDYLAPDDLDALRNTLRNSTHVARATEALAKEDSEAKESAEIQIAAKLKLAKLSTEELAQEINSIQGHVATIDPESVEFWSMSNYLTYLRRDLANRQGKPYEESGTAYPSDVAMFSSYLVRGGYIEALAKLLPPAWQKMTQQQLTEWLAKTYTDEALRTMYLKTYAERLAIKVKFRKLNIISALVTGLIWARENIKAGEWGSAAAKVAATGAASFALNQLLYARDKSAAELMAAKGAEYGRWFKGAARSNKYVDFLSRGLGKALLIWDLKDVLMSGGGGGPNIPFDIIETVDINDPATWKAPNQTLLDLGFNIWYRQAYTEATPEAGAMDLYVGKVEGSLLGGVGRGIGMLAHGVDDLKDKLYRIEGDYKRVDLGIVGWASRTVEPEENVLVVSTGIRSGQMASGKYGHYYQEEVIAANLSAAELLGTTAPTMVPQYVLRSFEPHVPGKSR